MIIGHVLPDKETSLVEAYEKCRGLADPKVCCDYALHVGITWWAPKVTVLGGTLKGEPVLLLVEGPFDGRQLWVTLSYSEECPSHQHPNSPKC